MNDKITLLYLKEWPIIKYCVLGEHDDEWIETTVDEYCKTAEQKQELERLREATRYGGGGGGYASPPSLK